VSGVDMSTLATDLREQATTAHSQIVLDASVIPADMASDIATAFALPAGSGLTVTGVAAADVPDPVDDRLTISTGAASVLNVSRAPIVLTFSAPGGALELIVAVDMGSSWTFTDSFAGLDGFPFSDLTISDAHFVYTTAAHPAYQWPTDTASTVGLAAGPNLLCDAALGGFSLIASLVGSALGTGSHKLFGAFGPAANQRLPVGTLRAPLGDATFSIGTAPNDLALGSPAVAVRVGTADDDTNPIQDVDLLLEGTFQETLVVSVSIPESGSSYTFSTTPVPGAGSVTRLIEALPGGQGFTTYIPSELSSVFSEVGLDDFTMVVDATPAVTFLGLAISTTQPWTVITDVLVLEEMGLVLEVVDPGGLDWTRVLIAAEADFLPHIFTGRFDFAVTLDKQEAWEVASVSGGYEGAVDLGDIVAGLLGDSNSVPSVLHDISFANFGVSAVRDSPTDPFSYTCYGSSDVAIPLLGTELTAHLNLTFTKTASGYSIALSGALAVGGQTFSLSLDLGTSGSALSATWVPDPEVPPLTLETIASAFGLSLPQLPSEIDIEFTGASFTYVFSDDTLVFEIDTKSGGHALLAAMPAASGGGHQVVIGAELGGELSLSDLPLVGHDLAGAEALSVSGLSAFATDAPLPAATAGTLNGLLPPTFQLPAAGLPGDVTLAAELCAGTTKTPFALSAGGSGGSSGTALSATQSTPAQPSTLWLPVQRSFGPVTVSQVGVRYSGGTVWFEISGALAAGPFSLQLTGLGFGVPLLDPSDVRFRLDGLGVGYSEPPLTIAGSFTNLSPPDGSSVDFEGGLVIEAEAFTLEAFAYYGDGGTGPGQDFPSMFIFLEGGAEIGGPPFFFVTGFAAGFGFNSSVTLPTVDQVATFPMIAALPGAPQPNPDALGGSNPSPLTVLSTLTSASPPWIVPERGQFWGAAGITFTTFELVQSQALLVVEAGQKLSLALLGLSTARFPPEGDSVYAQIELELEARLEPAEGEFWFEAVLAPSSFVIDPACHLTGGFAFCIWFGPSEHAGDFVLTLGGYHPAFSPPSYYPTVPRLEFSWQLSGDVTVGGKAYLALTPSAFMLGGELDVTFQSGNLRAWLTAGADVIIHWSPFWFDAHIWISVGASYRLDLLFTTVTLSVEIGADLELWGPPTGGKVTVDWYVIKFSIPFGSDGPDTGDADWTSVGKMLPASSVTMSATSGLTTLAGVAAQSPGQPWVVRGASFTFTTATPVPASHVTVGTDTYDQSFSALDVRPLAATGLISTHALKITDAKNTSDDVSGAFDVEPVLADVPASLWGEPVADQTVPSSTGQLVAQQAVGLNLTVKPPVTGHSAGPVAVDGVLAHRDLELADAQLPVSPSAGPAGPMAKADPSALSTVTGSSGISSQAGVNARTQLLTGLAAAGVTVPAGVDPTTFADQAGTYLVAEPLLAVLS
jgi:hypothetical protein